MVPNEEKINKEEETEIGNMNIYIHSHRKLSLTAFILGFWFAVLMVVIVSDLKKDLTNIVNNYKAKDDIEKDE